jgi:hypothetical protein
MSRTRQREFRSSRRQEARITVPHSAFRVEVSLLTSAATVGTKFDGADEQCVVLLKCRFQLKISGALTRRRYAGLRCLSPKPFRH